MPYYPLKKEFFSRALLLTGCSVIPEKRFSWRAVRHTGPREGTTVLCWWLRTGEESGHGSPGERRAKHRALARLAWRELEGTLRKVAFTKSHPTGSQWDFPGCVQKGTGEAGNEPGKESVFGATISHVTLFVFLQSGFSHQPLGYQLTAPFSIEFCPMASLTPWAETLKWTSFINFLKCAVYPAIAECFHHGIHIADYAVQRPIPTLYPHPHFGAASMVLLKPLSEFRTGRNLYDVLRFHGYIRRNTRPSDKQKVSGWDFIVRKTKAEDTGRPSLQTNSRSLLMMSAIWSVFNPPLRRARAYSIASSIFIFSSKPIIDLNIRRCIINFYLIQLAWFIINIDRHMY